MHYQAEILALAALLVQAVPTVARPAVGGIPNWTGADGSIGVGNVGSTIVGDDGDHDLGNSYDYGHGANHGGNAICGNKCCDGDYPEGLPTVTVTTCTNNRPTATVTITTGGGGNGAGITTRTVTATDTLVSSITACTATTTALSTITVDGPASTRTVTTAGPTVTSTVTTGAATVTDPASTTTVTSTSTTTATSTITDMQVVTSTATITQTDTLEITLTVTSEVCTPTNGGGGNTIDYGTCSDPTILYEYGLDGRTEYSYTTHNQADFPFGSSPTIGSPEDLICNRLRSPCNAPQATIDLCYEAEDATRNLTGQEAADVWNSMMT